MLTDKCNAIIDEAITAGGDLTKLSAEAAAHIETCLECRKSLESINALKASAVSVIPLVAADAALKSKIASSLEGAMAARRAASGSAVATKTVLGVGSVLLGVGLCGAIACGVLCMENKSKMTLKPTQNNPTVSTVEQVATSSAKTDVASYTEASLATTTNKTEVNVLNIDNNDSEDDKDMHNPNASESEELSQTLPSVTEDNGD